MATQNAYVIGIDFGTDSVRSVLLSTGGEQLGQAVHHYKRWADGKYCDSAENRFRQHPQDYLEGIEATIKKVVAQVDEDTRDNIKAISVDTTGSTPVAVDKTGTPLALHEEYSENPNAMFILWKDHTAIKEAEEINELSPKWKVDYTKYAGGVYSSEWFWAKIMHTLRKDKQVREAAYSWVEHCDWIPFVLTGGNDVHQMKRSRCAAGHKALWHEEFDGLPDQEYLNKLEPLLDGIRDRLYRETYTADQPAGTLSDEWAAKLGLNSDVVVGVGAFDAHMGAVGGEIEPYYLSRVMGTSTCDILIAPYEDIGDKLVSGICGQVDGSVVPGMVGLEAGQSAFGDTYAWFKQQLLWPVEQALQNSKVIDEQTRKQLASELSDNLIKKLEAAAKQTELDPNGPLALDWLNGRRTPYANQKLTAAIEGLDLGTGAPDIYRALVESTCFGAKAIVDRFEDEGVLIKGILGMGGVAKKSPFVMQTLTDVLNMPIHIVSSEQTCAMGAGMFAATAAGLFSSVEEAKDSMGAGFDETYHPDPQRVEIYKKLYARYRSLSEEIEERIESDYQT